MMSLAQSQRGIYMGAERQKILQKILFHQDMSTVI